MRLPPWAISCMKNSRRREGSENITMHGLDLIHGVTLQNAKANVTWCSQAVTHPSTDRARRCLTSVIGREPVFSTWYGRWQRAHHYVCSSILIRWKFLQFAQSVSLRRLLCERLKSGIHFRRLSSRPPIIWKSSSEELTGISGKK